MQLFCLIAAIVSAAVYGTIQMKYKDKYAEVLAQLDKKQYFFKPFLAGGLYIADRLDIKGSGRYFNWLHQKIVMLYGNRYAAYYMKIHWASKILYLFMGIFLAGMFGFLSGASGTEWLIIVPGAGIGLFLSCGQDS